MGTILRVAIAAISHICICMWIVLAIHSLWLNGPIDFTENILLSGKEAITTFGDHAVVVSAKLHTRHSIKQMSPWLVAGTYTRSLHSVLLSLLFPMAACMWSYFHKSWAALDALLIVSVFNQASNAWVWNLTAPKGNFWNLSTFTMNHYCITISIQDSGIICDNQIPNSRIMVLHLIELDNQTTSLCSSND